VVHQGSPAAPPGGKSLCQHAHHFIELGASQVTVGVGPAAERKEVALQPIFGGGLGHNVLSQHIERLVPDDDPVQLSLVHRGDDGRAFH
jgi:hypothetical protein